MTVDKIPRNSATKVLAIVGNGAKGYKGYSVEQCMGSYHPRITVLMDNSASARSACTLVQFLAETMAAAEMMKGTFDWSWFIMGNLQRQLTTIHSCKSLGIQANGCHIVKTSRTRTKGSPSIHQRRTKPTLQLEGAV